MAVDALLIDRLEHLRRGDELLRTGDERVGGDRLFDELLAPFEIARFEKFPGYTEPALRLLSTGTAVGSVGIHRELGFWREECYGGVGLGAGEWGGWRSDSFRGEQNSRGLIFFRSREILRNCPGII